VPTPQPKKLLHKTDPLSQAQTNLHPHPGCRFFHAVLETHTTLFLSDSVSESNSIQFMRLILQLLVTLLVFTGLPSHAWALDTHDIHDHQHTDLHDHPCHDHEAPTPCDSSQDAPCPLDHHHHNGCCCSGFHFIDARDSALCLIANLSQLVPICHKREVIPEGPYLSSDRPPLI
jgi:hypothetical protein